VNYIVFPSYKRTELQSSFMTTKGDLGLKACKSMEEEVHQME
jgi:hypothetical protein